MKRYKQFDWKETEKKFSWYKTGKWNMAYEAIDRHAESYRKNQVALYYDEGVRKEKYTFKEMKELSNKAGNLFKTSWNVKKVIASLYLCHGHLNYIFPYWVLLNWERLSVLYLKHLWRVRFVID